MLASDQNATTALPPANARLQQAQDLLQDHRVQAFLGALAQGESNGRYNVIIGGRTFDDYSRHPNVKVGDSTAAGAYQFIYPTWVKQAGRLGLSDFSAESQDLAAVNLLREIGAVPRLLSGDVDGAVYAAGKQWESLPVDQTGRSTQGNPRSLQNFKNEYYSRLY